MAGKPKYVIRAKSKHSGNKIYLAAFWENEHGISGTLDKDVAKIVLKNGSVITPDQIYLDLFINDETEAPKPAPNEKNQAYTHPDDAEVPF